MQLTRATPPALELVLERLSRLSPTYSPVGITLSRWPIEQHTVVLGEGQAVFERARAALQSWQTHQSRWLRLYPDDQSPAEGQTVLVLLICAGLCLAFGCRIVRVLDSERHFGFAYGSLPGHPERGEELFVVEWHSDDHVTFTLKADSQPANGFYRLGRLPGQLVRSLGTRQYLKSVRRAAQ